MAKQRRNHSIFDAIEKIADAAVLESKPNKTEEEKQQVHEAVKLGVNVLKDSNLRTLAEHGDDYVETMHQVDGILEEGGIDPVQAKRDSAVATAMMAVAIKQEQEPPVGEPPVDENETDETEQVKEPSE